jgi:hypothetical protein
MAETIALTLEGASKITRLANITLERVEEIDRDLQKTWLPRERVPLVREGSN